MKCPICGKDVELQKKQVGVDEQGTPIFHQYAVCRDCKKQWNLDKQRVRKAASDSAANAGKPEASAVKPEKASKEGSAPKSAQSKPVSGQAVPQKSSPEKPEPKKEAAAASGDGMPLEKKMPKKSSPENPASEKKPPKKSIHGEAPENKKTARKTGDGNEPPKARSPRKPAPGTSAPEKKSGNPEAHKASAEGPENAKSVSGKAERPENAKPVSGKAERPGNAKHVSGKGKRPAGRPASEKASGEKPSSAKPPVKKQAPAGDVKRENEAVSSGVPRKKQVRKSAASPAEQRYGNIPPEKVRAKKEHAVRQGYEDMLSTDPNHKPVKKKKALPEEDVQPVKKQRPAPVKQRPVSKADLEEEYDDEGLEYEDAPAKFHIPRIIFGVISILAAGFFAYGGFFEGLENIASGSTVSTGTTFIIFAICMLVSGLLLLIMQNRNTIVAFILPMIFYLGAAVFMFLKRQDNKMFLYCAVAGAVLGVIFLILGIISRNSDGYDGEEDYDDPFEDDYE